MASLRSRLPALTSLVAFEAAARLSSFTRAANELNVTRPAISRQIQALEADLGISLFHREYRSVRLTTAGESLAHAVSDGFHDIVRTIEMLRKHGEPRRVVVTTTIAFETFWLLPRLRDFLQECPHVDLQLVASDKYLDLASEGIDIAIRYDNKNMPDVGGRLLLEEELFPVCSPDYLRHASTLTTPSDLLSGTLLHLESSTQNWGNWTAWLRQQGVEPPFEKHGIFFNDYSNMIEAAVAGEGVALGGRHLLDALLSDGRLVRPISASWVTGRGYFLLVQNSRSTSRELEAFSTWLLREVEDAGV